MLNASSWFDRFIIANILASLTIVVLDTEPELSGWRPIFNSMNLWFAGVFTIEYIFRVWRARTWRYLFTPMAIIDLIALLPFYLVFFSDSFLLRLFRLARLLSLAKLGRFSQAHTRILGAIWQVRYELGVAVCLAFFSTVIGASIMYMIEGPDQPQHFGSILRSMWWGVVSLTTIGYGDTYPVTVEGKLFTAFYALVAIGFVSVVSGVLVSAVIKSFHVDQDGEYPTDHDYRDFELGFVRGKEDGMRMNAWKDDDIGDYNPFSEKDQQKMISARSGWFEGVRVAKVEKRREEREKMLKLAEVYQRDELKGAIAEIEDEKADNNP